MLGGGIFTLKVFGSKQRKCGELTALGGRVLTALGGRVLTALSGRVLMLIMLSHNSLQCDICETRLDKSMTHWTVALSRTTQ